MLQLFPEQREALYNLILSFDNDDAISQRMWVRKELRRMEKRLPEDYVAKKYYDIALKQLVAQGMKEVDAIKYLKKQFQSVKDAAIEKFKKDHGLRTEKEKMLDKREAQAEFEAARKALQQ